MCGTARLVLVLVVRRCCCLTASCCLLELRSCMVDDRQPIGVLWQRQEPGNRGTFCCCCRWSALGE